MTLLCIHLDGSEVCFLAGTRGSGLSLTYPSSRVPTGGPFYFFCHYLCPPQLQILTLMVAAMMTPCHHCNDTFLFSP